MVGQSLGQELADEAFSDLLKKHGRPVDLSRTTHF